MINLDTVSVSPVCFKDEPFLFELYASTRAEELDAWGWDDTQRHLFLQMQFKAQRWSYQTRFPNVDQQFVRLGDRAIGALMVDRTPTEMCLVSIALLPDYRNHGIGTRLIQELFAEAAQTQRLLKLQVACHNRAFHWYERLGFVTTGETGGYFQMEWPLPNIAPVCAR
ncbi:GNAT family N-acetyltransferase [Oculatella sp. LEGE 06141]|uniref:GNAT family N-acetyltransferase n=1 Tax=Oculatella sp. LEGE 06141 TaxID=1828648 RepID=UPI00187E1D4E|nr:GNAT family N-acetyltransferase [Oculatella sp. LEGE 06141]MBE9180905.1 GNAT family N-acetyltransferase [Oculatella sp. LEGE 06141]